MQLEQMKILKMRLISNFSLLFFYWMTVKVWDDEAIYTFVNAGWQGEGSGGDWEGK